MRTSPIVHLLGNDKTNIYNMRIATILSTVAVLLWVPQAWCIAVAAGNIATKHNQSDIWGLALFVLALGFVRSGLMATSNRYAFLSARAQLQMKRQNAVEALIAHSPTDIRKPTSGLAASIIAEQAETLTPYFSKFQPARVRAAIVPIVIVFFILPFSWAAATALMLSMPLTPIFMALIGWRTQQVSEEQLVKMGDMNAFLLDRLRGLATIRSLDAVDLTANRVRQSAESLKIRTMAVLKIAFLTSAVLEFFSALGVAMVAVYVGFHLLGEIAFGSWGKPLTLREGMFILLLAPAFFEPLRDLSSVWHDRAAGQAALKALEQLSYKSISFPGTNLLLSPPTIQENPTKPFRIPPSIIIKNLTFRYKPEQCPVFKKFSCSIAPGEHIALLGPSGLGKSTLLALIAGLISFEEGEILFDHCLLSDTTATDIRKTIAWLGQRSYVFPATLFRNVSVGRPDISQEQILAALEIASLRNVAEKYGRAPLGEAGAGLSGGEVLRLLLARAAANPRASVILADEPTAHLDTQTAQYITEGLLRLGKGKTMLVATHDATLAARMDRVIDIGLQEKDCQS